MVVANRCSRFMAQIYHSVAMPSEAKKDRKQRKHGLKRNIKKTEARLSEFV